MKQQSDWERTKIEDFVATEERLDRLFEVLSKTEKAYFFLLEFGFTREWIIEHFEVSRQSVSQIILNIKKKMEMLERRENEKELDHH